MKQKTKNLINHIINQGRKFVYDCGGWLDFATRLAWNAVMLWVTFGFVKALLTFSFISQGVPIPPERLEIVGSVIWIIGMIYLVLKIPTFSEVKHG